MHIQSLSAAASARPTTSHETRAPAAAPPTAAEAPANRATSHTGGAGHTGHTGHRMDVKV